MKSVAKVIKSFKNELAAICPLTEINSIIEIVFEHETGFSKTDLLIKSDAILSDNQIDSLQTILARLKNNEPVQYILGEAFFFDLTFKVAPEVLIPRQETEELIDWIIKDANDTKDLRVLDIGTGSGCIAISLAANLKKAQIMAYDVSEKALEIAENNAVLNQVAVNFEKKDILANQIVVEKQKFDIIVSNPPYVLEKEKEVMANNVLDFEPELALFVENDNPLLFYDAIVNYSVLNLANDGRLYFEINEAFGKEVKDLMINKGFKEVEVRKDLNGKDRMVGGKRGQ